MESLLRFKCFQIRQVNGEYRLDQLVSWRNLANFFCIPVILGFGGPMVIPDQARVQALSADGTIRVVTESRRSRNFWEVFWGLFALYGFSRIIPRPNFPIMEKVLDSYAGYVTLGIVVLVLLGFILLVNLQKASEVRRLKSLGLWGTVIPDNKAIHAERQGAIHERIVRPSGLSQKAWVRLFILMEIVFDLSKIGAIGVLLSTSLTFGDALLFGFTLLIFTLMPIAFQGYPGKSLYMRDFPRA